MNSVHAIQSIYEKVTPGADEEEHTTPILSLCHGFLVMALPREPHSREIRSKNKSP